MIRKDSRGGASRVGNHIAAQSNQRSFRSACGRPYDDFGTYKGLKRNTGANTTAIRTRLVCQVPRWVVWTLPP